MCWNLPKQNKTKRKVYEIDSSTYQNWVLKCVLFGLGVLTILLIRVERIPTTPFKLLYP